MIYRGVMWIGAISWFILVLTAIFTDNDFYRLTVIFGFLGAGFFCAMMAIEDE